MKHIVFNSLKIIYSLILINLVSVTMYFFINYKIYIVASGSMQPTLQINDMVVIKKQTTETVYNEGEIITFYNPDDDMFITHRIVEVLDNGYFTKGDYNNINDLKIITNDQIVGKMVYHSLFWGNLIVNYKFLMLFLIITFIILCNLLLRLIRNSKGGNMGEC